MYVSWRWTNDKQNIGENGLFGPFLLDPQAYYEFRLLPDGEQTIHHFFTPLQHNHRFMRLRAKPEDGLAAQLLSSIPFENTDSLSLVTYSKSKGLIHERDSLVIEGEEILTPDRAAAENTIIAMFHFDNLEDNQSGEDPSTFSFFPYFLGATDHFWKSDAAGTLHIELNETKINIPRYGTGILLTTL